MIDCSKRKPTDPRLMSPLPTAVIVEDDTATSALLAAVVRRHGFNPRTAGDGEAAIALLLAELPAVVLLDLKLPKLSGLEVVRVMRRAFPDLLRRTIVITAMPEPSLSSAGAELRDVRCVLQKPLDLEVLGDELALCLDVAEEQGFPGRSDTPS